MYQFAIVALLALAIVKLVDVVDGTVPAVSGYRSILTFVLGIATVWLADYSLFEGFGVAARSREMGLILTGFMVAGLTIPWRALLGWMSPGGASTGETFRTASGARAA